MAASGNSGNGNGGQGTGTTGANGQSGNGATGNASTSATSTSTSTSGPGTTGNTSVGNEGGNEGASTNTSESSTNTSTNEGANEGASTTTTTTTYNKQGVDANGLTKSGKNGDRNGDGKISKGESFVNNIGNWAYDVGQKANSFFGGADSEGNTKAGRAADRNGDGKISLGERIGNMFNNAATSINQTFGGVNYQGKNKSGEQVVAPGEHVTLSQRAKNIGHNLASRNGATWTDTNNNGIMDGSEVGRAAAVNAATFGLNLVPGFGKALGDFARGAATGKSNSLAGQLGTSFGEGANTNTNTNANNISYSSSTLAPLKEKEEMPNKANSNFIKRAKKVDISSLPAVTSTYIKRGEEKAPAITVSDEELKSFALRFYRQKTIK